MADPLGFRQKGTDISRGFQSEAPDADPSEESGFAANIGMPVWRQFVNNAEFQTAFKGAIDAEKSYQSQMASENRSSSSGGSWSSRDGMLRRSRGKGLFDEYDPESLAEDSELGPLARETIRDRDADAAKRDADERSFRLKDPTDRRALTDKERSDLELESSLADESTPEGKARAQEVKNRLAQADARRSEEKDAYNAETRYRNIGSTDSDTYFKSRQKPTLGQNQEQAVQQVQQTRSQIEVADQSAAKEMTELNARLVSGVKGSEVAEVKQKLADLTVARAEIAKTRNEAEATVTAPVRDDAARALRGDAKKLTDEIYGFMKPHDRSNESVRESMGDSGEMTNARRVEKAMDGAGEFLGSVISGAKTGAKTLLMGDEALDNPNSKMGVLDHALKNGDLLETLKQESDQSLKVNPDGSSFIADGEGRIKLLKDLVDKFNKSGITDGKEMATIMRDAAKENDWAAGDETKVRQLSDGRLVFNPATLAERDANTVLGSIDAQNASGEQKSQLKENYEFARNNFAADLHVRMMEKGDTDYIAHVKQMSAQGKDDPAELVYSWDKMSPAWYKKAGDLVADIGLQAWRSIANTGNATLAEGTFGAAEATGAMGMDGASNWLKQVASGSLAAMGERNDKTEYDEALAAARGERGGAMGVTKELGVTVGAMGPMLAGGLAGGAIKAAAGGVGMMAKVGTGIQVAGVYGYSGLQGVSSIFETAMQQAEQKKGQKLSEEERYGIIADNQLPALANGIQIALLTKLGSGSGVERLALGRVGAGGGSLTMKEIATQFLKRQTTMKVALAELKPELKAMFKTVRSDFTGEMIEEGSQQIIEGLITQASVNPDMTFGEIASQGIKASIMGGFIGAGIPGLKSLATTNNQARTQQAMAYAAQKQLLAGPSAARVNAAMIEANPEATSATEEELTLAHQLSSTGNIQNNGLKAIKAKRDEYDAARRDGRLTDAAKINDEVVAMIEAEQVRSAQSNAEGVTVARDIAAVRAEDEQHIAGLEADAEAAVATGDATIAKAAQDKLEKAKASASRADKASAVLKLSTGTSPDQLADNELRSLGYKSDDTGGAVPMTPAELKAAGLTKPLLRPGADGTAIILDEAINSVKRLIPNGAARITMNEAAAMKKSVERKAEMDKQAAAASAAAAVPKKKWTVGLKSGATIEVEAEDAASAEAEAAATANEPIVLGSAAESGAAPAAAASDAEVDARVTKIGNGEYSVKTASGDTTFKMTDDAKALEQARAFARQSIVDEKRRATPPPAAGAPGGKALVAAAKRIAKLMTSKKLADAIVVSPDPKVRATQQGSKIYINPEAIIADAMKENMTEAQAAQYFARILDEEIRHLAHNNAALALWETVPGPKSTFEAWRDAHYESIWKADFVATGKDKIVRDLYSADVTAGKKGTANFDTLPDWKKAFEAIRMMSQGNKTTEAGRLWIDISDKLREAMTFALDALKALIADIDATPTLKNEVEMLEKALAELKANDSNPADPTDSNEKPPADEAGDGNGKEGETPGEEPSGDGGPDDSGFVPTGEAPVVGSKVEFERKGETLRGTVTKIKKGAAIIKLDAESADGNMMVHASVKNLRVIAPAKGNSTPDNDNPYDLPMLDGIDPEVLEQVNKLEEGSKVRFTFKSGESHVGIVKTGALGYRYFTESHGMGSKVFGLDAYSAESDLPNITEVEIVESAADVKSAKDQRNYGDPAYDKEPTTRKEFSQTMWSIVAQIGRLRLNDDGSKDGDTLLSRAEIRARQLELQFQRMADKLEMAKSKRKYMLKNAKNAAEGKPLTRHSRLSVLPQKLFIMQEITPPSEADFDPNPEMRRKRSQKPISSFLNKSQVESLLKNAETPEIAAKFQKWLDEGKYMEAELEARGLTTADEFADLAENNTPTEAPPAAPGKRSVVENTRIIEEWFHNLIYEGKPVTAKMVKEKGETMGLTVKEAEEITEAVISGMMQSIAQDPAMTNEVKFGHIVHFYENGLPALVSRTSESKSNQAYSTPAPLAFVASILADIKGGKVVSEPTFGHGILLMMAGMDGQIVQANELDPARVERSLAAISGANEWDISTGDATTWTPSQQSDRIISNPPFGKIINAAGETIIFQTSIGETSEIDHAIMLKQLEAMAPDGRAVFIIGGPPPIISSEKGRAEFYSKGKRGEFFKHLYDNYGVVDHMTLAGKLYAKQGAAYPVDIIVIQGKKSTGIDLPSFTAPTMISSWDQLFKTTEQTDEQRIKQNKTPPDQILDDLRKGMGEFAGNNEGGRDESTPPSDQSGLGDQLDGGPDGLLPETPNAGGSNAEGNDGLSDGVPGGAGPGGSPNTGGGNGGQTGVPDVNGGPSGGGNGPNGGNKGVKPPRALTALEQEAADAFNDLFAAPLRPDDFKQGIPRDKIPAFMSLANKFLDAGVDTAEKLADALIAMGETIGRNLKVYSDAFWNLFRAMNPDLIPVSDWNQTYKAVEPEPTPEPAPEPDAAPKDPVVDEVEKEKVNEFQDKYVPGSEGPTLDTLAPKNLSSAMRDALLRLKDRVGPLHEFVHKELGYPPGDNIFKYFAAEQIDALALSIDNFYQNGALIVGDQTGVGKGRIVAGLIKWTINKGLIPVFVTKDTKLMNAMIEDDMADIGMEDFTPVLTNNKDKKLSEEIKAVGKRKIPMGRGVMEDIAETGELPPGAQAIFTTYAQISADTDKSTVSKAQIKSAIRRGVAPPGFWRMGALSAVSDRSVMILDESHLASGKSIIGYRFNDLLSNAKHVYFSSATFAKRPTSMAIYFRTNMRHVTDEGSMEKLIEIMEKGGVPAMQMASYMLALDGQMLRREKSFDGIKFETKINTNTAENDIRRSDIFTSGLREIVLMQGEMADAVNEINDIITRAGSAMRVPKADRPRLEGTNFSGKVHNLISQYMLAVKVDAVVEQARLEILGDGTEENPGGRKVVVAVQNTMESGIDRLIQEGRPLNYREMLLSHLDTLRTFGGSRNPVTISRTPPEEFANVTDRWLNDHVGEVVTDEEGNRSFVLNEPVVAEIIRRKMIGVFLATEARIEKLDIAEDLPLSPIDAIRDQIAEFGIKTNEITGRGMGLDMDGESYKREIPGATDVMASFNQGDTDLLVINQSGATGISLHDSEKNANAGKHPRTMIVAQPNLDINEFMQTLGRIHRSGQKSLPKFILLQTALPSERRPAASLGVKMSLLNANTTSNDESAVSGGIKAVDIFNKYGDTIVYQHLLTDRDLVEQLAMFKSIKDNHLNDQNALVEIGDLEPGGFARRITGYLAVLPVEEQELFWEKVTDNYTSLIKYLDENGENDLKAQPLDMKARTTSKVIYTPGKNIDSVFADASYLETVEVVFGNPPKTGQEANRAKEKMADERSEVSRSFAQAAMAKIADEVAKKEEKSNMKPEKIRAWADEQRAQQRLTMDAMGKLGKWLTYRRSDGSEGMAIIESMKIDESKPLAPSSQTFKLFLNDTKHSIRVPATHMENYKLPGTSMSSRDWDSTMDNNSTRTIVTGNLLAALNHLDGTGKVISYTKDNGDTAMGIMMPADFTAKEIERRERRTPVNTAEDFASRLITGGTVFNADDALRIKRTSHGYAIRVPAKRATGGKFWRNPAFTALLERPMEDGGAWSVSSIAERDLPAMFDVLKGIGEKLTSEKGEDSDGGPNNDTDPDGDDDGGLDAAPLRADSPEWKAMSKDQRKAHLAGRGAKGSKTKGISKPSNADDPLRVGTSKLGTKAVPVPTTSKSNISGKMVPPELLEKQMHHIRYDHLPASIRDEQDVLVKRDKFISWMKGNLLALYDAFPSEVRDRATHWYDGANLIAKDFGKRFGATAQQAAGVLAVLSPQKDWFMNVAQAEQVMNIWRNYQNTKITAEMVSSQMDEMVKGATAPAKQKKKAKPGETKLAKTRRQNYNKRLDAQARADRRTLLMKTIGKSVKSLDKEPYVQAWAIRLLAQSIHGRDYRVIAPEGEMMGVSTKADGTPQKNGWGSASEIMKAVRVLKDGSLESISENLGDQHKVRNFYNNIIAPNSRFGDATIDTHAVAAAHLMPMGASATAVSHNFGSGVPNSGPLGISGVYHLYLDAYRQAAAERGILPRQMQSIVWEAVRQLYPAESRRDKNVLAKAKATWKNNSDANARKAILRSGISSPTWAGAGNDGQSQILAGGTGKAGNSPKSGGGVLPRSGAAGRRGSGGGLNAAPLRADDLPQTAANIIALAKELDPAAFKAAVEDVRAYIKRRKADGVALSPVLMGDQITLAAQGVLVKYADNPRALRMLDGYGEDQFSGLNAAPLGSDSSQNINDLRIMGGSRINQDLADNAREIQELFDEEGDRSVGAPRLANPGDTQQSREQQMVVDAMYEHDREVRKDADVIAEGRRRFLSDPKGVEEKVLAAGYNDGEALTDADVVAARYLINQRSEAAGNDLAKHEENMILRMAYRLARAETARSLRIGFDQFQKPEDRMREFLTEKIYAPTLNIEKKAANENWSPAKRREAVTAMTKTRLSQIEKAFSDMGITLDEVLSGKAYLSLSKSAIMQEAAGRRSKEEQVVIEMLQKKWPVSRIRKSTGFSEEKIQAINKELYDELLEKARAKVRGGSTLENYVDDNNGLSAAPLTPEEIEAEARRIVEIGLGISPEVSTAAPATPKKPKSANPLTADWSRPVFEKGLESYTFNTTDRADILRRITEIRALAGAVGKIKKIQGPDRVKAIEHLKAIEKILAKHGTSSKEIFESGTPAADYRFDIRDRNQVAILARVIQAIDADVVDKTIEWVYSSILSGIQTMAVNALASVPATWDMTVGRGFEMAVNMMFQNDMSASSAEVKYILKAVGPSLSRAMSNAVATWGSETPMFDEDFLGREANLDKLFDGHAPKMGVIGGKKGRLIRTPTRALLATDEFNRTAIASIEIGAMAYRLAKAKGLTPGTAKFDRFLKIQVNTPGSFAAKLAADKASRLIFTNALPKQVNPVTGKMVPVEDFGDLAGWAATAINKFVTAETDSLVTKAALAAMRLAFFPFQRTPFNLIRRGVRHTLNPVSLIDIGILFARNSYAVGADGHRHWKWNGGGRNAEIVERLSQQLQGGMLLLFLMGSGAGEGDDDDQDKPLLITGSQPFTLKGRAERETQYRAGLGPYRISIRNKDGTERFGFNYGRIEPLATTLASTIDMTKSIKRAYRSGKGWEDIAVSAFESLTAQTQDKTFMKGTSDLISLADHMTQGDTEIKSDKKIQQFFASRFGMFIPNVIKQPIRESDDSFRERADTFAEELVYQVFPRGVKNEKLDAYGEPIKKPGNAVTRAFDVTDAGMTEVNPYDAMLLKWRDKNPGKDWFPQTIGSAEWKNPRTKETAKMNAAQLTMFREQSGKLATALLKRQSLNTKNPTQSDIDRMKDIHTEARAKTKRILSFTPKFVRLSAE